MKTLFRIATDIISELIYALTAIMALIAIVIMVAVGLIRRGR